ISSSLNNHFIKLVNEIDYENKIKVTLVLGTTAITTIAIDIQVTASQVSIFMGLPPLVVVWKTRTAIGRPIS
ncbi:MAG: hypothetical protein U9Q81_17500, partial [Pseudomonadota bacterium]|nr:hypothetical protein [Pseudomonadota bacterium]